MSSLGNKGIMAKNLNYYMSKNNKSRNEICNALGIKYTTLCDWLNSKTYPRIDKIEMLANYFGISKANLVEEHDSHSLSPINTEAHFVKIPVIGRVAAGEGCFLDEDILDYEITEEKDIEKGEVYRYLLVNGDSMEPKIEDGDLLLVRQQTSVDSGSIAVVSIDDTDGVVKRVNYGPDWIELKSLNPKYPPRVFEGEDVLRIRVLGLVRQIKRKLN